MKCLNLSSPVVQDALKAIGSEPAVMKILDQVGEGASLSQILAAHRRMSRPEPSGPLMKRVYQFLDDIGVDVQKVKQISYEGIKLDAAGIADFTNRLIQYVEGKEDVIVTEAVHFAIEILEQTNPQLFDQMLKAINSYDVYTDTLNEYKNNPLYQTKDGKPDIRKIKKEAIGKKVSDIVVQKVEADTMKKDMDFFSLWRRAVDWFRTLFAQANYNPFDEAAAKIVSDKGTPFTTDVKLEGVMLELNEYPAQARLLRRIKEINKTMGKTADGERYTILGVEVPKRVTDAAKEWYQRVFGEMGGDKKELRNILAELKAEGGTAGHSDLQYAGSVFVDENGNVRETPLDDSTYTPKTNREIYEALKRNLQDRINSFPPGTKFLFETFVYNGKDTGGTIDFLAITRDGKVSILDWKFMDLDIEQYTDVAWFKKKAFRIQINEYKKILQENYGVPVSDFQQTQVIPIKAFYKEVPTSTGEETLIMDKIQIGNVNVKLETKDYLLPVALEEQSTGDQKLDALITKLTGLRDVIEDQKAVTPKEKYDKAEQLNALEKALRHLQVKQSIIPLVDQAFIFTEEVNRLLEFYKTNLKDKDFREMTDADLSNFGIKINRAFDEIQVYTNLDIELEDFFKDISDNERKLLKERLEEVVKVARRLEDQIERTTNEFIQKVADTYGIKGMLDAEVVVAANKRLFISTSKLQMKTLQLFFQKRREAQNKMDYATDEQNRKLFDIRAKYLELAKKKGWTRANMFDMIVKKGTNKLIDQFQPEFYEEAKQALRNRNYDWIQENVDVEAFKREMEERLQEKLDFIAQKIYVGDNAADKKRKRNLDIKKAKEEFDLSTPKSRGWYTKYYTLRKFPRVEKWESKEWKELNAKGNEPVKELYDWALEVNKKANEAGYLPANAYERNFLPYVPKSWAEKVVMGGNVGFMDSLLRGFTVDQDTVGMGNIDSLSGKFINRIPIYFTRETDRDVSTDLFSNLALYNESVNRYQQLSDIEGIALALGRVERNKDSIVTSYWGKPAYNPQSKGFSILRKDKKSLVNTDLYNNQIATLLYGQRYVESAAFDVRFGSVNKLFATANKKLGIEIFPTDFKDRQFSLNKSMDSLNNYFRLKSLGLNPMSALTNLLGGHFSAIINSGRVFSKNDFLKSEYQLTSNAFSDKEKNIIFAAIKYFMPFTDDMNRDLVNELSLTKFSERSFQDLMFVFMRRGDRFIQSSIFLSIFRNQILIDGKMVNARDYVRQQPEYKRRYESEAMMRAVDENFEKDVEKLIEQYGVMKLAKVENGELVIPGLERNSPDVFAVRNMSKEMTKKTLGNLSPEEVRGVQQNVWLRSAMLFKDWIPDAIDVRYGQMKFNSATDAYEWGRARTMVRHFAVNGVRGIREMIQLLGNEAMGKRTNPVGLESLQKLYEYKANAYFMQTGQTLNMSEDDFKDMVRENLRNMAKDIIYNMIGLSMYFGAIKGIPPEDDEDLYVKNTHKFMIRLMDKFTDELAFFYSPAALSEILNTQYSPIPGMLSSFLKTLTNFLKNTYGVVMDDEEIEADTDVIKLVLKNLPITSQLASYMPLYAPDLAKELNIEMGTQGRVRY